MDGKFCRDCGTERPISAFTKNRNSRDGYAFYCREHARRRHQESRDGRTGGPRRRYPRARDVPEGHKWCPDCGEIRPFSAFGRNAASKTGRTSYCKPCHNSRGRKSKDLVGGERTYHLRRRYGITAQEADAMLEAQGGVCVICLAAPASHVDHDHATGNVRQLLCFNCNGGLGQFKDDPAVLRAAADYVERHRRRQEPRPCPLDRRRPSVVSRLASPPVGSKPRPPGIPRHALCSRGRARLAELERMYREADG